MKTQDERNDAVQYLLEELFLRTLGELEQSLCQHEDTEAGFYAGALAALNWVGKGSIALVPGDHVEVAARLREFIKMMQEPEGKESEPVPVEDGANETQP